MDLLKKIIKHPRFLKFVGAGLAVVIISGITAHFLGLDLDQIWNTAKDSWEFISSNKWALFLAIVILPALPFPMSLLLGAVGVAWSDMPLTQACALALVGVTLNMTWTYFVAAYPARKLIDKWLKLTKFKIPELGRRDYIGLIFLLRATPGIPLFIHNYILGFLRVPFFVYLPMSILITGCYVVGIIVTSSGVAQSASGQSSWQDSVMSIATGVGLLVIAGLITKFIRKAYASKKSEADKAALVEKDDSSESPATTEPSETEAKPAAEPLPAPTAASTPTEEVPVDAVIRPASTSSPESEEPEVSAEQTEAKETDDTDDERPK
ncbi:TVP38/TMEM64 family protein [Sulfuriroseicoccus oceanibius]|uniref:TVP38/TMEM64 family membrane protein n=1 Tax=Sulfuriroseicoccus oceanibius TaxID=2707525 RepID=A0A6B3L7X2_9BACT|nr:VTT domain-containing protein [Sulfuriroseicoccus oceanibius]QQL43836.1 VTT domain-containing protein [Sulfuriroseicoccus oceanibius]